MERVQINLDEASFQALEKLKKDCGFPTQRETIRQAVRFLAWYQKETAAGARILIQKDGKLREVCFLIDGET